MFNINLADAWFRTADLWSQKQLLHQLSHNRIESKLVQMKVSRTLKLPLTKYAAFV